MVIRGARASLMRARNIRSARRSRGSKLLSSSSRSTSSRTSSSSSTKSTSNTSQTKQIAKYEEVQKAADDLQKTAKALLELGTTKTSTANTTTATTMTASTTDTATATTAASTTDTTTATTATSTAATTTATSTTTATTATETGKTEEEQKKEIIACVKDLVEQYNTIYENLEDLGGTANTVFLSKIKQLVSNCEDELKKTGVTLNRDGTLSITTKTLESADLSTLKSVYCKSNGIADKLMERAENIESNAAATIKVLNRMYGTQSSYNKYGTASAYYGSSGSWYSALG